MYLNRIYSLVFVLISVFCFSQEMLRPLTGNLNYLYNDLSTKDMQMKNPSALKTQSTSIYLPFIDDFSYADVSGYPDPTKWSDSLVYINSGFPIRPPSIGVATFDGLNKYGHPYNPDLINLALSYPADTLTSRPINLFTTATSQTLQPSDSVALTFYYQARGNGDSPELDDSLIVDFYIPNQNKWVSRMWFQVGNANSNVNDTNFKFAFIWVADTNSIFLQDGFKFRFRAKGSPTGSFDNWHVDYVYLDKSLSKLNPVENKDLTFAYVPTPFLKDYSAMPYQQYIASEMAVTNLVKIKNKYTIPVNVTYEHAIFDKNNNQVSTYSGASYNLGPFPAVGYSSFAPHAKPILNYTFPEGMPDSMDYRIEHKIYESLTSTDFINENNEITQYQRFRNYYALDDGSAEAGYFINATAGRMAIKTKVNVTDSFLAVRIYINPVGKILKSQNSKGFRINVWPSNSAGTGPAATALYTDTVRKPNYFLDKAINQFSEYRLVNPKQLTPGTYYIGIQQFAIEAEEDMVTVGFDKNTDNRKNVYYDAGSGWTQSQIFGSLMIRPVFGKTLPPPVGISEHASRVNRFKIYPNPASQQVTLRADDDMQATYTLVNALGQEVMQGQLEGRELTLTTADLSNGIYFLSLRANNQLVQQSKLIIQH